MTREEDYQLSRSMRKEPIDDTFQHATGKQINFIEILRNDLGLSLQARNAHIATIVGKRFSDDVWSLSRSEASQIIDKFKQWKEERK